MEEVDIEEVTPMISRRFALPSKEDGGKFTAKGSAHPPKHSLNVNGSTTFLARWAVPIVFSYLAFGTLVFVRTEHWGARDSLYFAVTLLTTVGYGDLAPKTSLAKAFCCAYVICGVSMVSASLGVLLGRMQAKIQTTKLFSSTAPNHAMSLLS